MSFQAFLWSYLLGGLTFIPLLLAATLIPAWLLLPKVQPDTGRRDDSTEERSLDGADKDVERGGTGELSLPEAAAETTFAVLRSYDFQAANQALSARHSSGNTAGGVTGQVDGEGEGAEGGTSSVYQSVYRSVFAPSKSNAAVNNNSREVLENDDSASGTDVWSRKKTTPANVFYIVLRHGHLMLYDSAAQLEVRHVISLAHHTVSLSEGPTIDGSDEKLKDADLFIKRTAIVLTPTELPNGHLQSRSAPPKPFYLFSTLCSEKEDFYHALLYSRANPPIPEPLEPADVIKLQSTLHSTSLTAETRAFNALVGRVFLGIYHTPWLENLIQRKIERKIARVQKPSFLANITVKSVDLGDAAPVLSNPKLKDLNISGETTIGFDVKYSGGVKLTISALAKLDLGPRFKTRTVDLHLASSLQRLQGHMLVRVKPPPTNRIWFCFETPPDMDVKIEPIVSQRKISYSFVLKAIEDRIRAVVTETLVKPNWDDVPFFDTSNQNVRGGIWRDEGSEDGAEPKPSGTLWQNSQSTKSMPNLYTSADPDSSGADSGSDAAAASAAALAATSARDVANQLKRRSVPSAPSRSATNLSTTSGHPGSPERNSSKQQPHKSPRSPSFTSASASQPSVALDSTFANVDRNQSDTLHNQQRRWRMRPAPPPLPARREAVEAMREVRDRVLAHREKAEAETTQAEVLEGIGSFVEEPAEDSTGDDKRDSSDGRRASDGFPSSSRSAKRTDTASSSSTSRSGPQQKKTILAATAAATNAARNWSWNALQNARTKNAPNATQTGSTANGQAPFPQQPMGRGQPLPPPGQPLPGPQKGLFGALGSARRKPVPKTAPVLPPRRPGTGGSEQPSDAGSSIIEADEEHQVDPTTAVSDEYGPWTENSGLEDGNKAPGEDSGPDKARTPHMADVVEHAMAQIKSDEGEASDQHTGHAEEAVAQAKPESNLEEERNHDRASTSSGHECTQGHAPLEGQPTPHTEDQPNSSENSSEPRHPQPSTSKEHSEAASVVAVDTLEDELERSEEQEADSGDRPGSGHGSADMAEDGSDLVAIPAPVEDDGNESSGQRGSVVSFVSSTSGNETAEERKMDGAEHGVEDGKVAV